MTILTAAACLSAAVTIIGCAGSPRPSTSPSPVANSDKVWFSGSSNIRRFTCYAKQVNVSAEAAPEEFARTRNDGVTAVRSGAVSVPVRSLDCGIGLQNSHLFETLSASRYPDISFTLSDYLIERADGESRVRMNGHLRIAGNERDVVIHGSVFRAPSGQLMLRGDRLIDVRTFGVKPPRRFLGLLRVRDEVTVHFEVVVRPLIDPLGMLMASQ